MKKSSLDKEKRKKKGKTENTPAKAGGTENTKMSEKGRESGPAKKPNENKEEGGQKETRKAPQKGARKALRRAVKKAVKARSDGIAFSLLDRTAHGDMRGAAMMISLMEPRTKMGATRRKTGTDRAWQSCWSRSRRGTGVWKVRKPLQAGERSKCSE